MTDMRSTQAVQVTEQFAASCEEILELQIATKSWVAVEFDLDKQKRGVAVAARVVIEPEDREGEEGIDEELRVEVPVDQALALVAAEVSLQIESIRGLKSAAAPEQSAEPEAGGSGVQPAPGPKQRTPKAKEPASSAQSARRKSLAAARAYVAPANTGGAEAETAGAEEEQEESDESPEAQFRQALQGFGLGGFLKPLGKIMVTDMDALLLYGSVADLLIALREGRALPKSFKVTEPVTQRFVKLGLTRGAQEAMPAQKSWSEALGVAVQDMVAKVKPATDAKAVNGKPAAAKNPAPGSSLFDVEQDLETTDGGGDEDDEEGPENGDGADSGPSEDDESEDGKGAGEEPKPAKGGKSRGGHPTRSAITVDAADAPFTFMLVGAGPVAADDMTDLALAAGSLAGRTAFPQGAPSSFKRICDSLEVMLEHAVEKGLVSAGELREACAGANTSKAYRLLQRKAVRSSSASEREGGEGGSSATGGLGEGLAAAMLEVSSGGRVSESDAKIQEELHASRTRVDAVVRDKSQREKLMELKSVFASDKEATQKLNAFATVINQNAKVADLLYSANVREPTGARALEFGGEARRVVEAWRACRSGLGSAMRTVTRDMLPDNAESMVLVEAILKGKLANKPGRTFSVRDVALPKAAKSWLGTDANKDPPKGAEERNSLALLFTIWHPLSYGLQAIHPHDESVSRTIAILGAAVAKGVRTHGVLTSVDSVMQPFLRQLDEAWEAFQKTADAAKPELAKVWAEVSKTSQVAGYLAQASMQTAPHASSSASGEADPASKALKDLQKSVAQLAAKVDNSGRSTRQTPKEGKGKKQKKPSLTKVYENVTDDEIEAISESELGERPDNAGDNWARNRKAVKAYEKKQAKV